MLRFREPNGLRVAAVVVVLATTLSVTVPSKGLSSRPPAGAIRLSSTTLRTTRGVLCAYRSGRWIAGTRVDRTWFISFRQQATNYATQARKSQGATRANLQRLAGSSALKAVSLDPRCSRLAPPAPTQLTTTSTSTSTTSTVPGAQSSPVIESTSSTSTFTTTTTIDPDKLVFPATCPATVERAWEIRNGVGAGELVQALACGEERALAATGVPIKVGVMTAEGDPAGSFPEYFAGLNASVNYINTRLGGIGADIPGGVPGRPIELVKCAVRAVNPPDHLSCANSLVSANVDLAVSTLLFLDNYRSIFSASGIKEIVGLPLKVSDNSSSNTRSVGSQGCTPLYSGMIDYVTRVVGARSFSLAFANTPPGIFCYDVGAVTAADVITGRVPGDSARRGSKPEFVQTGVKVTSWQANWSSVATAILNSGAELYGLSAYAPDCSNVISKLIENGWSTARTQLILSTDCYDAASFANFGASIDGVLLVGAQTFGLEAERVGLLAKEYELVQKYLALSVSDPALLNAAFIDDGFVLGMRLWQASNAGSQGSPFSGSKLFASIDAFTNQVAFGGGRLSCAKPPYASVCDLSQRVYRYSNGRLEPVGDGFSGFDLLSGTDLYSAPLSERRILNP